MNISTLANVCRVPLLGEINDSIIAIAVCFDTNKKLIIIRFYIDELMNCYDDESIRVITSEIYTTPIDANIEVADVIGEQIPVANTPYTNLDPLDGFLFARKIN